MICPNCKNPIQDNSIECEWCGCKIPQTNIHMEMKNTETIIRLVYNGIWFLIDCYAEVYVNEQLLLKSSVKDGFNFEIKHTNILPTIKFKIPLKTITLELPKLDNNKSYLIEIEYSRMWHNFSSKPKSIKEI
jgi:hypothetical protein